MSKVLFENKPIREENFIFEDKWGKFFMYSSSCKRFTEDNGSAQHKVEIWSEDTPDGKPWLLNIKLTTIRSYSKYSPRGSEAYIRFDYNAFTPGELYYIVDNCRALATEQRCDDYKPGETIYIIAMPNRDYEYVTKEQFYDVQFIEENVIRH